MKFPFSGKTRKQTEKRKLTNYLTFQKCPIRRGQQSSLSQTKWTRCKHYKGPHTHRLMFRRIWTHGSDEHLLSKNLDNYLKNVQLAALCIKYTAVNWTFSQFVWTLVQLTIIYVDQNFRFSELLGLLGL